MRKQIAVAFFAALAAIPAPAQAVTIPTVPVGNLGNAADPLTGNLYGAVSYAYRIGTTEVTNSQYAAFLTEKAKSDPLNLYNTRMDDDTLGGITRGGVSGSFTYAVKTNMGDKPVNYVTWYDAIRFANWLNNGQGSGATETGAYTLLGGGPTPSNGLSITRNADATWLLPRENEWYKAAYYQPAAQGGDSDNYWLYPTKSNSAPTIANANSIGDISNPGANVANYSAGASWGTFLGGNVTTVGSAGPLSESFYGTSDQGGNTHEWNEAMITFITQRRGVRGGSWGIGASSMQSSNRFHLAPTDGGSDVGFRVAMIPEPSSFALAAFALIGLVAWRRRKR